MRIGEGYVAIRPDLSGFRPQLRAGVTRAVASIRPAVKVGANFDPTGLRRQAQRTLRAMGTVSEVRIGTDLDARSLRRNVSRAVRTAGLGQKVTVGMEIRGGLGGAGASIAGLGNEARKARPPVDSLTTGVKELAAGGALVFGSWKALKAPAMVSGVSAAIPLVGTLTAGTLGLVGSLSQVAGLAPAVGSGALAVAQGFGVAKLATMGLGDALKAAWEGGPESAEKMDEALKDMDPSARRLVGTLASFKGPAGDLQRMAQAGLFPGVDAALRGMQPLFGRLAPVVVATSLAMGGLAVAGGEMGRELGAELQSLGMGGVPILESLGRAAIKLAPSLVVTAQAAQPLALWMSRLTEQASEFVLRAVRAGEASGRLGGFFDRTREKVIILGHGIRDFGVGLFRVFRQAVPLGDQMIGMFERGGATFRRWTESISGQRSLDEFFSDALPPLRELGGLVGDVGKGIGRMWSDGQRDLQPLIAQVRSELLPALFELFGNIDGEFLSALIRLTTAATKFFTVFGTATPALTAVVNLFSGAATAAVGLVDALGPVGDVLVNIVALISAAGLVSGIVTITSVLGRLFSLGAGGRALTGILGHLGIVIPTVGKAGEEGARGLGLFSGGLVAIGSRLAVLAGVATWLGLYQQGMSNAETATAKAQFQVQAIGGPLGILAAKLEESGSKGNNFAQGLLGSLGPLSIFVEKVIGSGREADIAATKVALAGAAALGAGLTEEQAAMRVQSLTDAFRRQSFGALDLESANLSLKGAVEAAKLANDTYGVGALQTEQANNFLKQSALRLAEQEVINRGLTLSSAEGQAIFRSSLEGTAQMIGGPVADQLRNLKGGLQEGGAAASGANWEMVHLKSGVEGVPDVDLRVSVHGAQAAIDALRGLAAPAASFQRNFFHSGGQVPGHGVGDVVPAMLEPGEFVVRKPIVQAFGPRWMEALNAGLIPLGEKLGGLIRPQRLREGGPVEPAAWRLNVIKPDIPAIMGGPRIDHLTSAASALARTISQRFGTRITSMMRTYAQNRAVGGAANSDHLPKFGGFATASDHVGSMGTLDRAAAFARSWPGIKQVIWRAPGHWDHLHVATRMRMGGLAGAAGAGFCRHHVQARPAVSLQMGRAVPKVKMPAYRGGGHVAPMAAGPVGVVNQMVINEGDINVGGSIVAESHLFDDVEARTRTRRRYSRKPQ